jgi:electron transport complex protein RnfD
MTDYKNLKLIATSSPHIRAAENTRQIMLDVLIALLPALCLSVFVFGARALALTVVSVWAACFSSGCTSGCCISPSRCPTAPPPSPACCSPSACPVTLPVWTLLIGDAFAIVLVKQLYGGIGKNFLNPALAARAFLMASWPVLMTVWSKTRTALPVLGGINTVDIITTATPLSFLKSGALPESSMTDMALGMIGGCLGETSALALLVGGLWLLYRRVITLRIPLSFLGTVAVLTFLFPKGGNGNLQWMLAQLLSGGLMLGAIFMATDYSTSPVNKNGQIVFGVGCGVLTVFIRYFGSYPEGVSYAILIMNAFVFLIEKATKPRKFGYIKPVKAVKGGEQK